MPVKTEPEIEKGSKPKRKQEGKLPAAAPEAALQIKALMQRLAPEV